MFRGGPEKRDDGFKEKKRIWRKNMPKTFGKVRGVQGGATGQNEKKDRWKRNPTQRE